MPKVPSSGSYTNGSSQKKNTSIQKNINHNKIFDSSKASTNKKKNSIINSNSMNKKAKEIIDQYSTSNNNKKKSIITQTKIPSTSINSELTTNFKQQTSTNSHLYNINDYTKNSNNNNVNNKVKTSNQDLINRLKNKSSALKFSITSKNYYINIKNKNQNVNSFQLEEEPYDKNKKRNKVNQDNFTKGINISNKFDTFVHEVKYLQKDKNKFNKTTFNYYFDKTKNLKNTKSFDINKNGNKNKDKKHFILHQGNHKEKNKQDIICVDKTDIINAQKNEMSTNKENDKNKMNINLTKEQNEIHLNTNKENIIEDIGQIKIKNKGKKDVIKSKEKEKDINEKDLKELQIISDIKENTTNEINDNNIKKNENGNNLIEGENKVKKDENTNINKEKKKENTQEIEKNNKNVSEKSEVNEQNDKISKKEEKEEIKKEKEINSNKNELNNRNNENKEENKENKEENKENKEKNGNKEENKEKKGENKEEKKENNQNKIEEEIKYNSPVKKNKSKKKKKTKDFSSATPIVIQFKPLSPKNNIEKADPDDLIPTYFTTSSITDIQIPKDYLNIIYYNLLIEEKENRKYFKAEYNYMNNQKEINEQMRSILIDWIIDVHGKFGFCDETLYMTVSIIDRYSSLKKITRNEYQCLGITALMISCKHEEINVPKVEDFIYITDNAYNKEEVFNMEIDILDKLNYNLLYPSPIKFYEYLSLHFGFDKKKHYLGKYLMETFLLDLPYIKFKPSTISCACVYVVMKFFKMKNYKESYAKKWYMIEGKQGYELDSGCGVKDCAQELCNYIDNINSTNYLSCQKKYAADEYFNISKLIFNSPENNTNKTGEEKA